jgi:hypothetical protein
LTAAGERYVCAAFPEPLPQPLAATTATNTPPQIKYRRDFLIDFDIVSPFLNGDRTHGPIGGIGSDQGRFKTHSPTARTFQLSDDRAGELQNATAASTKPDNLPNCGLIEDFAVPLAWFG